MRPIQLFLYLALVLITLSYFKFLRKKIGDRIAVSGLTFFLFILIIFPDFSSSLANFFGMGRGLDFVIVISLVIGVFITLVLYSRLMRIQHQITELARTIALSETKS